MRHEGQPFLDEQEWMRIAYVLELSDRELEVVRGVWRGQTEGEIAAALEIAPRTVHTYMERIYVKLGVHNRAELIQAVFAALDGRPPR